MGMLAGTDDHSVKFIRMIEHLAEVDDCFGLGMSSGSSIQIPLVHIAQRDDIFGSSNGPQVRSPSPPCSDHGHIQLFDDPFGSKNCGGGKCQAPCGRGCCLQKPTSINCL